MVIHLRTLIESFLENGNTEFSLQNMLHNSAKSQVKTVSSVKYINVLFAKVLRAHFPKVPIIYMLQKSITIFNTNLGILIGTLVS